MHKERTQFESHEAPNQKREKKKEKNIYPKSLEGKISKNLFRTLS